MGQQEAAPVPSLNPDPIASLVGNSIETPVILDGQRVTTLIDLGVKVSSISFQFCEDLTLQIRTLGRVLELEGTGGSAIPYLGYVEVNLQIPGIKNYNEDIFLLVMPTMTYSEKILVTVGSNIIDQAMKEITKGELAKVTMTWKQAHFGAVMSGSLQLPHTGSNRTGAEKEVIHSPKGQHCGGEGILPGQCLRPPFGTVSVNGNTSVRGHCMHVHMLAEPMPGPKLPTAVVPTVTYGELHLGSSCVPISLCNLRAYSMEIPTKAVVGQVLLANQVSLVVLPTGTLGESISNPKKGWILGALDLQGLGEWPKPGQEQAWELLLKWEHLFACSNLDLGRTTLIKHRIEVTDWMPFKEHY